MRPVMFPEMNKIYGPPANWDEATMGVCLDLPVKEQPGKITSCYELDMVDIANIECDGAKLYFTIYTDKQPVVSWEIR